VPFEDMYRKPGLVCDQDDGAHGPDVTGADTLPDSFPCALSSSGIRNVSISPVPSIQENSCGVKVINNICGSPSVGNESMRIWRRVTYS
jgi:hypothetical protein